MALTGSNDGSMKEACVGEKPFTFSARIPYSSNGEATLIRNALAVDSELRPECVEREIKVEGEFLVLKFCAVDIRTLRAAVGTFCDLLGLATRTLEAFPQVSG